MFNDFAIVWHLLTIHGVVSETITGEERFCCQSEKLRFVRERFH